jgi:hypothetical protein
MLYVQQNIHQTSFRGILDLSQRNLMFLEPGVSYVPKMSTCSRNSIVELLHGGVGRAKL